MTDLQVSTVGRILSILPLRLHGLDVLFPRKARWITNRVLPFWGVKAQAAKAARTKDKQGRGARGFVAVAVGAIYGMGLELTARQALHLVFGAVTILNYPA